MLWPILSSETRNALYYYLGNLAFFAQEFHAQWTKWTQWMHTFSRQEGGPWAERVFPSSFIHPRVPASPRRTIFGCGLGRVVDLSISARPLWKYVPAAFFLLGSMAHTRHWTSLALSNTYCTFCCIFASCICGELSNLKDVTPGAPSSDGKLLQRIQPFDQRSGLVPSRFVVCPRIEIDRLEVAHFEESSVSFIAHAYMSI